MKKEKNKFRKGQVTLEFAFCMVIIFLMLFAIFRIFKWTGLDLAERRIDHDDLLTTSIDESYSTPGDGPLRQIDPFFHEPMKIDAIWKGQ